MKERVLWACGACAAAAALLAGTRKILETLIGRCG